MQIFIFLARRPHALNSSDLSWAFGTGPSSEFGEWRCAGPISTNSVAFAWNVARSMGKRDSITYTSLVTRFNELGKYEMALSVINHMYGDGIRINQFCLPGVISASTNLHALEAGKHLHCYSMKSGYSSSVSVLNSKFGSLNDAKKVFKEMDVVSWNVLVSGLASNGLISSALSAFEDERNRT